MSKLPENILQAGCTAYANEFLHGNGTFGEGIEAAYFAINEHEGWVRAEPKTWDGEGLPPVGTICEVVSPGYSNKRFDRFVGQVVTVISHDIIDSDPVAVFRVSIDGRIEEQDYHALVAECFRPARTAEQIEAEERDAAVRNIMGLGGIQRQSAEWIYDAGYRKQPAP